MRAQPALHLDAACYFPWRGVNGCKGKDVRAMLRLTVSDDIKQRQRLEASRRWYNNIRESYEAGR
jgi:hypothetical protein